MQFFEKNKALYQKDLTLKIGTKCDFRDWPGITFEAVVEAMFAQFDYNFQIMWVWYFLFVWYFHKKNRGEPVHQKQFISSVWKLMNNTVVGPSDIWIDFSGGSYNVHGALTNFLWNCLGHKFW